MTSTCIPQCLSTFLGKWLWFTIQNPCKSSHLWRFQTLRNLVSCGRRGTSWHSNMFHNVSEVVLCDRGNTFALFSKDEVHFSWQAQHFGDFHSHYLRGRRSTLDESCCVFFVNRIVKTASSGGNVQIQGRRCILWDVMKINGCLARNIHFEVVDFGVRFIWALAGERRFCGYKVRGGLARNDRFEAPTCLVSILWFSCGVAVPMVEAAQHFIFEGFNTGSNVVLRGKSGI